MGHAMDSGLRLSGREEDYADELERRVRRARPRTTEGARAEIEVIRAELLAAAAQGGPYMYCMQQAHSSEKTRAGQECFKCMR